MRSQSNTLAALVCFLLFILAGLEVQRIVNAAACADAAPSAAAPTR